MRLYVWWEAFRNPTAQPDKKQKPGGELNCSRARLNGYFNLTGRPGGRIRRHRLVRAVDLHFHATVLAAGFAGFSFIRRLLRAEPDMLDAITEGCRTWSPDNSRRYWRDADLAALFIVCRPDLVVKPSTATT